MRQLATVAPLLLIGCLSYDKFGEKYAEKDCNEGRECAETYDCGDFDVTKDLPLPEDCDFDRSAARECLKADWECNDTFVGFEYAQKAAVCDAVCGAVQVTEPGATNGENI